MSWLDKLKDYAPSIAAAVFSGGATLPQLAAKMISDATGVKVSTVAEAEKVINAATPDQLLAIKKVDNQHAVEMAKIDMGKLGIVNETMRVESQSSSRFVSWWRPFFGYCVAISWFVQMTGLTFVFCYMAIKQPSLLSVVIGQFALLAGSLTALWGIALAVLGISVHKRSKDKENGTADKLASSKGTGMLNSIKSVLR